MTITFPEWFLQVLAAAIIIHAVGNLIYNYYEGKIKRMKSAMMGMEMAVRLGELKPEDIGESINKMIKDAGKRMK